MKSLLEFVPPEAVEAEFDKSYEDLFEMARLIVSHSENPIDTVISDDRSGRWPALVVSEVVGRYYNWSTNLIGIDPDVQSERLLEAIWAVDDNSQESSRRVFVTDYLSSGVTAWRVLSQFSKKKPEVAALKACQPQYENLDTPLHIGAITHPEDKLPFFDMDRKNDYTRYYLGLFENPRMSPVEVDPELATIVGSIVSQTADRILVDLQAERSQLVQSP